MDKKVYSEILDSYKKTILHCIVTSFGLDFIIYDQDGGDVDTIHNVRESGQYKNPKNAEDYANRGKYDSFSYHGGNAFYAQYRHNLKNQVNIEDAYVPGNKVNYGKATYLKNNPSKQAALDHIISAKEIHDDRGRVLAQLSGSDLANQESNYAITNKSLNSSMKDMPIEEYIQSQIDKGTPLPEDVVKQLRNKDSVAREKYNEQICAAYYTSKRFIDDAAKAAINLGARMGVRQALGFVFIELWFACENEIKALPDEIDFSDCIQAIIRGLKNGAKNAKEKYKEILKQFGEGFVSGCIASLETTLINIFITIDKNKIRYIRQISVMVVQVGNIILINPNYLRLGDQIKEATISIVTGASTLAGTIVGNQFEKVQLGLDENTGIITRNFISALVSGLLSCSILILIEKSKFVLDIVAKMNRFCSVDVSLHEKSEAFIKMAAEIKNYDISEFCDLICKYEKSVIKLQTMNDDELNEELKKLYEELDLSLPWNGEFDDFMNNRNNRMVFY